MGWVSPAAWFPPCFFDEINNGFYFFPWRKTIVEKRSLPYIGLVYKEYQEPAGADGSCTLQNCEPLPVRWCLDADFIQFLLSNPKLVRLPSHSSFLPVASERASCTCEGVATNCEEDHELIARKLSLFDQQVKSIDIHSVYWNDAILRSQHPLNCSAQPPQLWKTEEIPQDLEGGCPTNCSVHHASMFIHPFKPQRSTMADRIKWRGFRALHAVRIQRISM